MKSSSEERKVVGIVALAAGLLSGAFLLAQLWTAQRDVRDATPYPATLLSVAEPECSGSKTKTCRVEAVARLNASSATIEQPAFAGSYSSLQDANDAHSAHVVGAPTTIYQLSRMRDGHLYHTAPAFEQLREDGTPRGNVLGILRTTIFILIGAGSLLFNLVASLRRRDDL